MAGKAARDAILLSNFRVETLPVFVAASALISFPVILVTGRQMTRYGPGRLMPALNAISAVAAIVEWFLLGPAPHAAAVAIYVHLSIAGAVLVSGFWSIINERFDVQRAKRHIGRIGTGATLGGILGGLLAQGTAAYLPPDSILLVLAGLQLASGTLMFVLRRARRPGASRSEGRWFALGVVTRSRLLRNLAAVVVLGAIATGVLDYVFKADLVAGASKAGLLRSLATYYTVTSLLTAIVQITICGPLIARVGVPRSVVTLPLVVTAFGVAAVAAPITLTALVARGAEAVTRSSVYRAGYELLYAPLPEADKRPTKVMLDVGAARIGDLLGAQVVGLIVLGMASPRLGLLIAVVVIGVLALVFALRLRRSYTLALEDSLVAQGADPSVESWPTLHGLPVLGESGDASPLPARILEQTSRRRRASAQTAGRDELSSKIADLCSSDASRIQRVLGSELAPELAALVIPLVARDDVGRDAVAALRRAAPRCTGMLVDALLDGSREIVIRRRLADVLVAGEPALAAWGLWRGLVDPSFEVRYQCGVALSKLAAAGRLAEVTSETAFEAVRRELLLDRTSGSSLEHVFTVLGLVLPAEPLRIALHAMHTGDSSLRATALEYLETILPADVRAKLWPLIDSEGVATGRGGRSPDELVAALHGAYARLQGDPSPAVPAS